MSIQPTQVTLVPDSSNAITSNAGWDCIKHKSFLSDVIGELKNNGIRTSIFLDPNPIQIEAAKSTGADRIELYTELFAREFSKNNFKAVKPYTKCAEIAIKNDLGVNAGHDLCLDNIKFFKENVPNLKEVSLGHALISESIYFGIEYVVNMYKQRLL